MKLYIFLIAMGNFIIDALNILFLPSNQIIWYMVVFYTAVCTIACFFIDLFVALCIRALPKKLFAPEKKIFKINNWERGFYEHLGVRLYKDKIPDVGKGFKKGKLAEPNSPEYLRRYMIECCYGEVIHLLNILLGFLAIFVVPFQYFLTIALPVALVNAVLSLLPIFVLRYNRKKIEGIYQKVKFKALQNLAA